MTGLWRVPLQSLDRPANQSNNLNQVNGKESAIKYLHASEFIPVQGTWARSVNRGYFNTWPGITSKYINRMPKAESTIKVHLAQSMKIPVQKKQQEQWIITDSHRSITRTR